MLLCVIKITANSWCSFKKIGVVEKRDGELGMSALAVYAMTVNSFWLTHTCFLGVRPLSSSTADPCAVFMLMAPACTFVKPQLKWFSTFHILQ
jgi:hypothetical protein